MRLALILALCSSGFAATVRVSCGGPGGVDAAGNVWQGDGPYSSGGATWAMPGQQFPYNNLRFSNPAGSPFSYSIPVNPPTTTNQYIVTLKFMEPTVTAAGKRRFSVSINGVQVAKDLDLFAAAGLLKPYDLQFPVTASGVIVIALTPTTSSDKAVISGIQIDTAAVPIVPAPQTGAFINCFSGNVSSNDLKTPGPSQEVTIFPVGTSASGPSGFPPTPLVGVDWRFEHVMLCEVQAFTGPAGFGYLASMGRPGPNTDSELMYTQMRLGLPTVPNCWYAHPPPLQFDAAYGIVVNVSSIGIDPTTGLPSTPYSSGDISQLTGGMLTWEVCGYSALVAGAISIPIPNLKVLALDRCQDSGVGWNCAGLYHAAIGLQDGTALSIVGPNMALPVAPLTTWTPVK